MLVFYLLKARGSVGGYMIDCERFPNMPLPQNPMLMITHRSNVPVIAAPWQYNLGAHFRNFHKLGYPALFPLDVKTSPEEESV
jgi:hypothetical protein